MNAIQKLHALLVSKEINVWHFHCKKAPPRFYYWLTGEADGYGFDTLEEMIDSAYAHIDPLNRPLPQNVEDKYLHYVHTKP